MAAFISTNARRIEGVGGMTPSLEVRLDRNYRYQRFVYDLTRRYYLLGRERLIDELDPPVGGTVLEIGCGTARNLVLAAERYPAALFFGLDLSGVMLETAAAKLERRGMRQRVSLAQADATAFDPTALFGRAKFDRIFLSYSLSMIPDWRTAVAQAARCLAPHGSLHIVDFGDGHGLPSFANGALRSWLARFHVEPRDRLEAVLRDLAQTMRASLTSMPLHGGYAYYAILRAA